ncbi:uncharacterized protein K460DRAFT_360296 [Cucurbitaria berberidis CBS 394.84]|uniref:Uncharacterized protein n=1 Tax=Cucurbitaria berberidis CBS 394.84 TaxID=1168544 RepID=A0A9P4G6I4_9PLEO|nr:uncharacterized protein K460DRAFT_360296 [Cucurbitaria berberidis CBS 394.84]KAF1839911.1 hypothetical protein K460DRAFT_360296 [Cucurbitaria berberidis CBS 394.84]
MTISRAPLLAGSSSTRPNKRWACRRGPSYHGARSVVAAKEDVAAQWATAAFRWDGEGSSSRPSTSADWRKSKRNKKAEGGWLAGWLAGWLNERTNTGPSSPKGAEGEHNGLDGDTTGAKQRAGGGLDVCATLGRDTGRPYSTVQYCSGRVVRRGTLGNGRGEDDGYAQGPAREPINEDAAAQRSAGAHPAARCNTTRRHEGRELVRLSLSLLRRPPFDALLPNCPSGERAEHKALRCTALHSVRLQPSSADDPSWPLASSPGPEWAPPPSLQVAFSLSSYPLFRFVSRGAEPESFLLDGRVP